MLPNRRQMISIMDAKGDVPVAALGAAHKSFELVDDVDSEKSYDVADWQFTDKDLLQSFSGVLDSVSRKDHAVKGEQDAKHSRHFINIIDNTCMSNGAFADNRCLNEQSLAKSFVQRDASIEQQQVSTKEERESTFVARANMGSVPPKTSHQAVGNSASGNVTYIDVDDPDICILEDMSEPAPRKQSPVDGKSPISAQRSSLSAPPTHMGFNNARLKANDERFIYRVALQDLSQPKSEVSAPDGSLVVSLLRHQRIALSWMVQKETKSLHCFGGILADDQGLGKTISTIALILKERSPSSSVCTTEVKKIETETLNLDDDDDDAVTELDKSKQKVNSYVMETNGSSIKFKSSSMQTKSRPAAGTLVVCPTSVLRQWNDELHNKVSSEANLSVLVYHGANRTKDPFELAKYDVVLTTYAIVSMEVPKQPLVDEDEDETRRRNDFLPVGISPGKKRKYPPSSSKSSKKDKKGMDNELFESLARPLAKVRWFRVVLDEAQSIKNHRTQVARACWGLRAKRRWCLSGTPIQNAIDDLYSYFRFLRYDPYAVYKSFCSTIKAPIQRSPGTGYKKLQAVLKTIMLRRTKATLLDGEPIISLPPKTINLKKVDFTAEERDFYCRLEADSRAQFAEYAAAGTVKQNYVNILLMLLRLRQACDHPLLVKGCSSNSEWKSSIDKAKKLPPEKRSRLLNCLEASLAICSICSDPPEDAVVTTCEHVFCNQCILEHLSSDDSQCPSSKCKVILNTSSVFSKSTLRISLGDQYHQGNALDCSGSLKAEIFEPCSSSGSVNSSNIEAAEALDSSKIKAALEVLQSIAKPRDVAINAGSFGSPEKCSSDPSGVFDKGANVKGSLVVREKAIVFSQWTRMLDLLEACLKDSSIGYRRLDGTMSVVARDKAVKDFNTLPEVSVMIMSLKAASLGLNMVAACHVLLLDLWWNPTTEDQAIDRAHRIGQTRPVSVLRLTVKDTVEDRILALQQKKREMVSSAFGEDETGSSQTRLTVDDLKYLFQA
ncbi:helicase-like transcription factor CHR28 isoform X5 [Cynara cardunculus var. scolymus]|nr:helicase-like transcription factor CHR28 isoform X5 [Cynara cardunculus var. scolymus]